MRPINVAITRHREKRGWGVEWLAARAGLEASVVDHLEEDPTDAWSQSSVADLVRLQDVLGIDLLNAIWRDILPQAPPEWVRPLSFEAIAAVVRKSISTDAALTRLSDFSNITEEYLNAIAAGEGAVDELSPWMLADLSRGAKFGLDGLVNALSQGKERIPVEAELLPVDHVPFLQRQNGDATKAEFAAQLGWTAESTIA